jgi:SAM-dependent methyltransferase
MVNERYHFGGGGTVYNANDAAEHLLRYHVVRGLCAGKRVLDVACGEGYGSYLLATWGAARVVGIDVAVDAIKVAQRIFAHPNVTYLRGDACRLADVLADDETFDVIVSFETIEHVGDIGGLLSGIAARRAPGATIVISCPNDHAESEENPHHLRAFTLTEFQEITSATLGPATEWWLGTPILGEILQNLRPPIFKRAAGGPDDLMMRWMDLPHAVMIPPQPETAPAPSTCRFYLGVWGEPCGCWTAVAPISYTAHVGPWLEAQRLKREILDILQSLPVADGQDSPTAELRARIALQASQHATELAERMAESARLREAIEAGEALRGELTGEVQASAARVEELLAEIAGLRETVEVGEASRSELTGQVQVSAARAQELLAEVVGLRSHEAKMRAAAKADAVQQRELEEQIAELRRTVLTQIRERRATTAELEHVRAELSCARDELATAREELSRLQPEAELWRSVRVSRSYRITRAYVRVYSLPVLGLGLRLLRRPVGKLWRRIR